MLRLTAIAGGALLLAMTTLAAPERQPFRLVSAADEARYRKLLPPTEDGRLLALYEQPLIFYTDREMPRAYQLDGGAHSPDYNISATKPVEPHGNANLEFPWGHPAGTHRSTNASAVRFVHLPGPILWWRGTLDRAGRPENLPVMRWQYPDGTVFGEILLVHDAQNVRYTFELRTRTRRAGSWAANAFRPFASRAELDEVLAARFLGFGLGEAAPADGQLKSEHPGHTVIDRRAALDVLPPLPPAVVRRLLARPFRSVLGAEWVRKGDLVGHAPTTQAPFHIVPVDYDGAYLEVGAKACMACHDGVLEHTDRFDRRRDWYGRVRGDDFIFSFHPFEPADISRNGFSRWPRVRQSLVDAGLLRQKE